MIRRNFIKGFPLLGLGNFFSPTTPNFFKSEPGIDDTRQYWIKTLTQIVSPVLESLSRDALKKDMPVEAFGSTHENRKKVTYLEALGRSLAGLAPWLELGVDDTPEGRLRNKFITLATTSIRNAVTPSSSDFMNFTTGAQPLVDAAFLAHALIRAPKQLWGNLDQATQSNLITALRSTRVIKPYYSNWLLFTAMVEAALLKFSKDHDPVRIDYAIKEHEAWYKGDGVYGDGPTFHFDYYNSYVIQPFLIDVAKTVYEETGDLKDQYILFITRAKRYAEIQERLISPEGTFPLVGRSIAYRCGAFQLLAQIALQQQLPASLAPAQVRSALTAVIKRTMDAPKTFDPKGWLTIGVAGHQAGVGEAYISTGSLYLCATAFLPLGLSPTNDFWSKDPLEWTSVKAFSGKEFSIDKAIKD